MPDHARILARPETCWYCCAAPATLWCDFLLGAVLAPGKTPPAPTEVVETCDVAACSACAARLGWRCIAAGIVCTRGRRGGGCHPHRTDHCHLHASAEGRGSSAWLGAAGVALARAEARTACRLAGGRDLEGIAGLEALAAEGQR